MDHVVGPQVLMESPQEGGHHRPFADAKEYREPYDAHPIQGFIVAQRRVVAGGQYSNRVAALRQCPRDAMQVGGYAAAVGQVVRCEVQDSHCVLATTGSARDPCLQQT